MQTKYRFHVVAILMLAVATMISIGSMNAYAQNATQTAGQTTNMTNITEPFVSEHCKSWSSTGGNQYWNLTPGLTTVFKGIVDGEPQTNTITVMDKTINLGGIDTRVVNDTVRNSDTSELVEIAFDYFAVCNDSNSVFYFGEYTTDYEETPPSHKGSWAHSINGTAGVVMPGINLLGARYYEEVAPPDALDVGETVAVNVNYNGYTGCIKVKDTSPLEPGIEEFKIYCPGVGLVDDNGSKLQQ